MSRRVIYVPDNEQLALVHGAKRLRRGQVRARPILLTPNLYFGANTAMLSFARAVQTGGGWPKYDIYRAVRLDREITRIKGVFWSAAEDDYKDPVTEAEHYKKAVSDKVHNFPDGTIILCKVFDKASGQLEPEERRWYAITSKRRAADQGLLRVEARFDEQGNIIGADPETAFLITNKINLEENDRPLVLEEGEDVDISLRPHIESIDEWRDGSQRQAQIWDYDRQLLFWG